jgi:hypothetical protein
MQSPSGGLNARGRAYYNAHGSHLQPPVTKVTGPKSAARRKSFCARCVRGGEEGARLSSFPNRMSGNPGPLTKPNGDPTRKKLALQKWHCR